MDRGCAVGGLCLECPGNGVEFSTGSFLPADGGGSSTGRTGCVFWGKNALVVGPWKRYSAGLNISGCDDVDSSADGVAEVCSFVS